MRRGLLPALAAVVMLSGCPGGAPSQGLVANQVTSLKVPPADVGEIRGFVNRQPHEPIPGVTVRAGRFTTLTGNPIESQVVTEEVDDGRTITVMHTFPPLVDPVLVERRPRQYRALDCQAAPMSLEERWDCAYVYLRAGEFLFEGLPAGAHHIKPVVCDLDTPETAVQVRAGVVADPVDLMVDLPIPVILESHDRVRVVDWTGISPSTVKVQEAAGGGYQLSPGEVTVTLRSPPGSGGNTVVATDIEYKWTVEQGSKVVRRSTGRREIPRTDVPAGTGICWGPATELRVPLGSLALDGAFSTPGVSQVEATITFLDEGGPTLNRSLETTRATVTLSR